MCRQCTAPSRTASSPLWSTPSRVSLLPSPCTLTLASTRTPPLALTLPTPQAPPPTSATRATPDATRPPSALPTHVSAYLPALSAGYLTVMASYSSWHGTKLHRHRHLLTDVLKDELGFDGLVVSDFNGAAPPTAHALPPVGPTAPPSSSPTTTATHPRLTPHRTPPSHPIGPHPDTSARG